MSITPMTANDGGYQSCQPQRPYGIIGLTYAAELALHVIVALSAAQRGDQRCQIDQIGGAKMRPSGRNDHERLLRLDAGPAGWHPQQIPIWVTVEDPIFTPPLLPSNEIDFPLKEWMKWMCNPNRRRHFSCARCSSLGGLRPASSARPMRSSGRVEQQMTRRPTLRLHWPRIL